MVSRRAIEETAINARMGSDRGAGLAEYALLLAFIAILMVGAISAFSSTLQGLYNGFGPALFN